MKRLRIAVIGAGRLGGIHARLLASLEQFELVAVVDPVAESRRRVAEELGVDAVSDHRFLHDKIDAAVIAAPTVLHHHVAMDLLARGIHLLVEKPLASTFAQADAMAAAAQSRGLVLQCGHVERFNPAFVAVQQQVKTPRFIEALRCSGYTGRSIDIGVVLDLMIHDLDLAMALAGSPVEQVQALGAAVIGPHEDMANARLTFANGCVANLTASRTSFTAQRRMQVFAAEGYAGIDFAAPGATIVRPGEAVQRGEVDVARMSTDEVQHLSQNLFSEVLPKEDLQVESANAILEEQRDFAQAITTGRAPRVTGRHACDVIGVAERILQCIAEHRWNGAAEGPVGPRFSPLPAAPRRAG